jgi:hypothetical protein
VRSLPSTKSTTTGAAHMQDPLGGSSNDYRIRCGSRLRVRTSLRFLSGARYGTGTETPSRTRRQRS